MTILTADEISYLLAELAFDPIAEVPEHIPPLKLMAQKHGYSEDETRRKLQHKLSLMLRVVRGA